MSLDILNVFQAFLLLLLAGSIVMSAYLVYDLYSGNYRKFLSARDKHTDLADKVQEVRRRNLENQSGAE